MIGLALSLILATAPDGGGDGGPVPSVAAADGGAPMSVTAVDELRRELARVRHGEAIEHFKRKDYPQALQGFREAYELDPHNAAIANDLAYLYYLLGNHAEAERYYRETLMLDPNRAIARVNLADLLHQKGAKEERLAEAAHHLMRARELQGNRPAVILRQARVAALRGHFDEAERFYRELLARRQPSDAHRLEIGDFYRDFGRDDEALSWYRQVTDPKVAEDAAKRIWRLTVEREARRLGWTRPAEAIPEKARSLAEKGRRLSEQRRLADAERLLRRAVRLAPQFARARADLGDVLREAGRRDEAEVEYLRALALDQGNAEIFARLGELYLRGRRPRAAEAALFLSRALQLRPEWGRLHLLLARAYRAAGDLPSALQHVNRFLAGAGDPGGGREEALALQRVLAQLLPAGAPRESPEAGGPSRAVAETLGRARAFLAQGQPDAAMAELRRLGVQDRGVEVLNLEGRILHAAGRFDEAASAFLASLARDEAQAEAHEQIGLVRARQGREDDARRHARRAEELGSAAATYHLARLDAGNGEGGTFGWVADLVSLGRLLRASDRLDRFLAQGSVSAYLDEARALRLRVSERLRSVALAGAAAGLLVLLGAVVIWIRLWGGIDLHTLLERHPEAGPEVQRVLSAIRHEVLKHNTLVLTGLVEAIERGEDAAAKAAHCRKSLFGTGGGESAAARLKDYAARLQQIGRAHGERLNLVRKDPALSALGKGFRALRRVAPSLSRVGMLSRRQRARLLRGLRAAVHLLNTEGYEAVRGLLDQIRVLEVDRGLLVAIYERTCREPAFAGARLAPLELEIDVDQPCGVLIPRQALEDILANLLRNAIQSSLRHGEREIAIGLAVRGEVDPITGIERVVFLIRDRSPQVLTAEMVRGRYIEEGLGLTADLVSRYEGTLDVLPGEGGWTKAVTVKFPRGDAGYFMGENA